MKRRWEVIPLREIIPDRLTFPRRVYDEIIEVKGWLQEAKDPKKLEVDRAENIFIIHGDSAEALAIRYLEGTCGKERARIITAAVRCIRTFKKGRFDGESVRRVGAPVNHALNFMILALVSEAKYRTGNFCYDSVLKYLQEEGIFPESYTDSNDYQICEKDRLRKKYEVLKTRFEQVAKDYLCLSVIKSYKDGILMADESGRLNVQLLGSPPSAPEEGFMTDLYHGISKFDVDGVQWNLNIVQR